jgi:hypothetical protein
MYGKDVGSLQLKVRRSSEYSWSTEFVLWALSGEQRQEWVYKEVTVKVGKSDKVRHL